MACSLCNALNGGENAPDFIYENERLLLFRGPFFSRWPGALMAVSRRHRKELSDLHPHAQDGISAELIAIEKSIRVATGCARMNVVKFGNVCEHLHWHLIPRYNHEQFGMKTPWEVTVQTLDMLYASVAESERLPAFLLSHDSLYKVIGDEIRQRLAALVPPYFSCAFFFRPKDPFERQIFLQKYPSAKLIADAVRDSPAAWETFLMQRNYADFSWDNFGGGANAAEFPEAVLHREIFEETGWKLRDHFCFTRQWNDGRLRGFAYVAIPESSGWMQEVPDAICSDEVKECGWFAVDVLLSDPATPVQVHGRLTALLEQRPDFRKETVC